MATQFSASPQCANDGRCQGEEESVVGLGLQSQGSIACSASAASGHSQHSHIEGLVSPNFVKNIDFTPAELDFLSNL